MRSKLFFSKQHLLERLSSVSILEGEWAVASCPFPCVQKSILMDSGPCRLGLTLLSPQSWAFWEPSADPAGDECLDRRRVAG